MSVADAKNNLLDAFLDDYFAECDEHLINVQRNLLAIESYINQSQVDRKLLDELFHSFHTLKGLSGMVSLQEAELLAHQMESYLKTLRDQKNRLSAAGVDGLILGTKVLEETIKAYQAHTPVPDIQTVVSQLSAAFNLQPTSAFPVIPQPPVESAVPAAAPEDLTSETRSDTIATHCWQFEFTPAADLIERNINVNTVRERLQTMGEILQAEPRITDAGGVIFRFTVNSAVDKTAFAGWEQDGLTYQQLDATVAAVTVEPDAATVEACDAMPTPAVKRSPGSSEITLPSGVVRVDLIKLNDLMRMVGELVITRSRLEDQLTHLKAMSAGERRSLQEVNQTLERQLRELREGIMRVRLVPIGEIFTRMHFVVRDLARESQKQIRLELEGQETEIDKFVVERMMEPLLHLVRNAVSHALEGPTERVAGGKAAEGRICLRAFTAGETVVIEVEDDGRGIDAAQIAQRARDLGIWTGDRVPDTTTVLDILCAPGFSTREAVDRASGRGVGMAIVKSTIAELGGSMHLQTHPGKGTCFTIQLPLTLAITDALIVTVADHIFAIPQAAVCEVMEIQTQAIKALSQHEIFFYRDQVIPLLRLSSLFRLPLTPKASLQVLVVGSGTGAIGIAVDRIVGQQEIVVQALTDALVQVPGIVGATELGNGQVVLILDTLTLIRFAKQQLI